MESELEKSANDEIRFEFNNWKKKLSRMSSETAKELEHKDPVQLIRGLMGACQKYFPRHVRFRLTSFFQFLLDYRGMHDLLLLAVCRGVYGVQKKVREEAVPVSPGVTEVNSGRDVQMAEEMNKFVKKDVCTPFGFPTNFKRNFLKKKIKLFVSCQIIIIVCIKLT